jgi:tRNA pseudouridine55 synthase
MENTAYTIHKLNNCNGWLIIDKPAGMTSAHVVAKIKRLFKAKKVGHGGTLDPFATGVLPIALGEATKTLTYILEGKKTYRFEIKWGEETTTLDPEGEVIKTSDIKPSRTDIEAIMTKFTGPIQQIPPAFSALKVDGKRAYALAREGKEVNLKARKVVIDSLKLVNTTPDTATFKVTCSKGTYVRSLARDIAQSLGTVGYVKSLRRLLAAPFSEEKSILLDSLLKVGHNSELMNYVLPLQEALADILALEMGSIDTVKLRQGQSINMPHMGEKDTVLVMCEGQPVALSKVKEGKLIPIRVFNI